MSQISKLKSQYRGLYCCLYIDRRCLSFIHLRPSHNFPFLNNQTCCVDTLVTKACFYHFFLHQTQSKRDGNVRKKSVADIIYPKSSFGRAGASGPSTRNWAVWVG